METVAIIGTGRMGSLIARKIYSKYNIILIDKDLMKCGLLAKEIGGTPTSEYSMLPLADYIIIALPATIIPKIIPCIKPLVKHEQILINISTDTEETTFEQLRDHCRLSSAKIIGHAQYIAETNEPALVIVDGDSQNVRNKVAEIFAGLGTISFEDEKIVRKINNIASEEGIKAALNIKKRLEKLNIPYEYFSFAIRNVACGTMSAYVLGDAGPFVKEIIRKICEGKKTDSF